jgi:hypothetical protein
MVLLLRLQPLVVVGIQIILLHKVNKFMYKIRVEVPKMRRGNRKNEEERK